MKTAGNEAYFDAQDRAGSQSPDLWVSDGSLGGTRKVVHLGNIHGRGPATRAPRAM